jgi:hypothetical protein
MTDEKQQYRVRAGQVHGAHKQYGEGAVLELTEAEAAGFLDKLELVPVTLGAAVAEVVTVEAEPAPAKPRRRPASEA